MGINDSFDLFELFCTIIYLYLRTLTKGYTNCIYLVLRAF